MPLLVMSNLWYNLQAGGCRRQAGRILLGQPLQVREIFVLQLCNKHELWRISTSVFRVDLAEAVFLQVKTASVQLVC